MLTFPLSMAIVVCFGTIAYIANNVHPDQTAPLGAVWSGFIVFVIMVKLFWSVIEYMQQTK